LGSKATVSPFEVEQVVLLKSSSFLSQVPAATRKARLRNGAVLAGSLVLHAAILAALGWPIAAGFVDRSNDEDAIRVTLERSPLARRPAPEMAASPDRAASASPLRPRAPRLAPPSSVTPLGVAPVFNAGSDSQSSDQPEPRPRARRSTRRPARRPARQQSRLRQRRRRRPQSARTRALRRAAWRRRPQRAGL
jgi:hypothetical protein